jgi:hypothetical protein
MQNSIAVAGRRILREPAIGIAANAPAQYGQARHRFNHHSPKAAEPHRCCYFTLATRWRRADVLVKPGAIDERGMT